MSAHSELNKVLEEVIQLTQASYNEYSTLEPNSAEQLVCRGQLLAYNSILELFSRANTQKLAAGAS